MKYILPLLLAISAVFAEDIWFRDEGRVVLTGEAAYIKLANTNTRSECLAEVAPTVPSGTDCDSGKCLISDRDAAHKYGYDWGWRGSLLAIPNRTSTWQLQWLGQLNWKSKREAECTAAIDFPFTTIPTNVDYENADRVVSKLHANYWDAELNYWGHVTPRHLDVFSVSWLIGLRYADFAEKMNLAFTNLGQTSNYKIHTKNHMGGIQFGGDFQNQLTKHFLWGLSAKIGGMVNRASQATDWKDDGNLDTLLDTNSTAHKYLFFAHATPFISIRIFSRLYFQLSYEGYYYSNVAIATNQVDYDPTGGTPTVRDHNDLMLHGAFAGFSIVF